jgi:hypothetical protein
MLVSTIMSCQASIPGHLPDCPAADTNQRRFGEAFKLIVDKDDNVDKRGIMNQKTCAVCGKAVYKNTGAYFAGRLIHKWCAGMAKNSWHRL